MHQEWNGKRDPWYEGVGHEAMASRVGPRTLAYRLLHGPLGNSDIIGSGYDLAV